MTLNSVHSIRPHISKSFMIKITGYLFYAILSFVLLIVIYYY